MRSRKIVSVVAIIRCAGAFAPPTCLRTHRASFRSSLIHPSCDSNSDPARAVVVVAAAAAARGSSRRPDDRDEGAADPSRRDALAKGAAAALSALFLGGDGENRRADAAAAAPDLSAPVTSASARGGAAAGASESGARLRNLAAVTAVPSAVAVAGSSAVAQPHASSEGEASRGSLSGGDIASASASSKVRPLGRRDKIRRAARAVLRIGRILWLAAPVVVRYPRSRRSEEAHERWLEFVMHQCERGGAVVIKMAQWASSRPDIFGTSFANTFKRLQDGTTPHSWEHTEGILRGCYGEDWRDHLRIDHEKVLGSGCIAQVYKGRIENDGKEEEVAVKVVHPGVRKGIEDDINVLWGLAHFLERLPYGYGEKLKWNNLSGMVEEFARMLRPQLDLQNEAEHLRRFNEQFRDSPEVLFPKTVESYEAHPDVLVETFCTGVPVEKFCQEQADDKDLRARLCEVACRTVTTMVFQNNYVHGDLHPGNVFVSPDNKLVLLDCGIVNEYDDADHDLLVNIIASFIRMDGRRAAELMADDANRRLSATGESVRDAEKYISEIEQLSKTPRKTDFAFEKVTTYVDYIFNAAARHHVKMNSVFVSMMLAVKVQEGVALLLNPAIETVKVANPIILRSEAERMKRGGASAARDLMRQQAEDAVRNFRVKFDRQLNKAKLALEGAS